MLMNILYINLVLYILQIWVISFWIYIWYKNYKELMRKNILEESPFLRIASGVKNDIKITSYSKTPIIINKLYFYWYDYESKKFEIIPHEQYPLDMRWTEIYPNEITAFSYSFLDNYNKKYRWKYRFKIVYENHIKSQEKIISLTYN